MEVVDGLSCGSSVAVKGVNKVVVLLLDDGEVYLVLGKSPRLSVVPLEHNSGVQKILLDFVIEFVVKSLALRRSTALYFLSIDGALELDDVISDAQLLSDFELVQILPVEHLVGSVFLSKEIKLLQGLRGILVSQLGQRILLLVVPLIVLCALQVCYPLGFVREISVRNVLCRGI